MGPFAESAKALWQSNANVPPNLSQGNQFQTERERLGHQLNTDPNPEIQLDQLVSSELSFSRGLGSGFGTGIAPRHAPEAGVESGNHGSVSVERHEFVLHQEHYESQLTESSVAAIEYHTQTEFASLQDSILEQRGTGAQPKNQDYTGLVHVSESHVSESHTTSYSFTEAVFSTEAQSTNQDYAAPILDTCDQVLGSSPFTQDDRSGEHPMGSNPTSPVHGTKLQLTDSKLSPSEEIAREADNLGLHDSRLGTRQRCPLSQNTAYVSPKIIIFSIEKIRLQHQSIQKYINLLLKKT